MKRPGMGPHTIQLSAEAHQEWREFAADVEPNLREGERFGHMRDWAGKLPGAAVRIAGLIHCGKHALGSPEKELIELDTMRRSLALVTVLADHALAAFDLMGADLVLRDARKVWAWVNRERNSTFTFRECFRALQGTFPRAANLEPAIDVLVERAYIAPKNNMSATAGRPVRTFQVNPSLAKTWEGESDELAPVSANGESRKP
jgi:hypothetical protein